MIVASDLSQILILEVTTTPKPPYPTPTSTTTLPWSTTTLPTTPSTTTLSMYNLKNIVLDKCTSLIFLLFKTE